MHVFCLTEKLRQQILVGEYCILRAALFCECIIYTALFTSKDVDINRNENKINIGA